MSGPYPSQPADSSFKKRVFLCANSAIHPFSNRRMSIILTEAPDAKREYTSPRLTVFGNLTELTQSITKLKGSIDTQPGFSKNKTQ